VFGVVEFKFKSQGLVSHLINAGKDGEVSVRSAMRELEADGYLVVDLHNSGKSTYVKPEYKEAVLASTKTGLKTPDFIDVESAISDWINDAGFLKFIEVRKDEIKERGIKLTNKVKIEHLSIYINGRHLYLDNIHKAISLKSSRSKLLLYPYEYATITIIYDSKIGI
jgi:hypothetical protein